MDSRSKISSPTSQNRRPSPAPRIGTKRNFDNPTRGDQIGKVAKALGQTLMPWQQLVADIAGEVDPRTGLPVYREIDLLVPRQSGKTTLLLAEMVHRAWGYGRPQNTRYAAQTGDDAIAKWKEHVAILEGTPFRKVFSTDDTNGQKALVWANQSTYRPTATTKKSGHGKTLDQAIIDEAFAQIDFRTEQAMRPAMITRRDAQLFVVSTAGDATSIFLNSKITSNRERLEAEPDAPSRIAYLEWSAPEDAPADDEETWWQCMPALGRTIHIDEIRAELEGMEGGEQEFRRAYLNQTDQGAAGEPIFTVDDWQATADDNSIIRGTGAIDRSIALDIAPDRTYAAVAWAGGNQQGRVHHEVIAHERGTHWLIPFLAEKLRRNGLTTVTVVAGSQGALLEEDLTNAGIIVRILSRAEYAAACARFSDSIENRTARHLATGQLALDIAVAGAVWTKREERTFDKAKSTTDITPLVVCAVAAEAYRLDLADSYDVLDSVG